MACFVLVPSSSHKVDEKLKYEVPSSFREEVEEFVHKFYMSCGYAGPINDKSAAHFYAKTTFVEGCTNETELDILMKVLCERNLLFERDFDILGHRRWENYRLNHEFTDGWKGNAADVIEDALAQTVDEFELSGSLEELYLMRMVEKVRSKKLNVKRARSIASSFEPELSTNTDEMYRLQHIIWPCFISNWSYLLWRRDIKVEYRREINEEHWKMLYGTKIRLQSLEFLWDAALDAWKTLKVDKIERQFNISEPQCLKFLEKYHVNNDMASICARKMYQNAQNNRGTANTLVQAIIQCLNIPEDDLWVRLIWIVRIREYFVPDDQCGAEIDQLCQEIFKPKQGSSLTFFRELSHKDLNEIPVLRKAIQAKNIPKEPRWMWLSILQLGIQIVGYLEDCFLDGKEYLAITDPNLLQSTVIERYKNNYSEQYGNLIIHLQQDRKRLKEYQGIWDSTEHTIEDRQDFLKKRLRYVRKFFPTTSPDIWSDYVPVQAQYGKRDEIIQKHIPQLQLLIFENAMQDCICSQMQRKLWGLLTANFLRQL